MKNGITLPAVLLLLGVCGVCAGNAFEDVSTEAENARAQYRRITPDEAYEQMKTRTVTVVDVRTESEYAEGHISGAVLVPNDTIGDTAPAALQDKDAALLVYCRSGRRSREASKKLLKLGYRNVADFGGIRDWKYDVVVD